MARQSKRVAEAEAAKAAATPEVEDDAADIEEPKAKVTKKKPVGRPKANTAAKRAEPAKRGPKPKAPTAAATKAAGKAAAKAAADEKAEARPVKAATGARGRGRPKKDDAAPAKVATKRKKSETPGKSEEPDSEERQAKKLKEDVAAQGPPKRARKVIVNPPRYTQEMSIFVFGEGSGGELGLGSSRKAIDVKRPRFNADLSKMGVVRLATGGMHCVALTSKNELVTWGVNDNGALGRDTTWEDIKMKEVKDDEDSSSESDDDDSGLNPREATPTAIPSEYFPEGTTFVDVAAGDSCSFALTDDGFVFGWGCFRKNEGILGFSKEVLTARTPMWVPGLKNITKIVCGTNHVLALDTSQKVWAWGNGQQNQLGRRLTERNLTESLVPTHVGYKDSSVKRPSKKMVDISCGAYHAFSIGTDGRVWSWGVNNYGETGIPEGAGTDNATIATPTIVQALEDLTIHSVKGGTHHNLAVLETGQVLAWGRCDNAALGLPREAMSENNVLKDDNGKWKILMHPTILPGLKDIAEVSCGPDHNIAITKTGKAFSWGFSATYQTGLGTDDDIEKPTLIDNTAVKDKKLIWAGCGGQYSMLAAYANGAEQALPTPSNHSE